MSLSSRLDNFFKNSAHVAPSQAQIDKAGTLEQTAQAFGLPVFLENPVGILFFPLTVWSTVGASSNRDSLKWTLPCDLEILGVYLGCESAAGGTGVGRLIRNDGTSDTDLCADTDVKTGVGVHQLAYPNITTEGADDLACYVNAGDTIRIRGTSGSGGAITGLQAWVVCRRR